jgi:signal transduction histidine kinase
MCHQNKTRDQLLHDLRQSEIEIQGLKGAETILKELAKTLQLNRDLYVDLSNALPSGIYRIRVFKDVSLIEDRWVSSTDIPYDFEYANDRFFEILNIDRQVFESNPGILHSIIHEDDRAEFARMNVESNLNTTPFMWEGRLLIHDKTIWIYFKSIPRVLENGDIIWTGTLEDITKRKQTEAEIKLKNAELQTLNADKDRFISILAHDLKDAFNSILGFLNLLTSNLRKYDIDTAETQLAIVNSSALKAYYLLDDILMWALSQSGKLSFEPSEFSFKTSCDTVVDFLKPSANNKGITINVADTEGIIVFADVNMLNTILRNLISNAIKFTSRGGRINLYAEQNSMGVTICIADNGMGIAPLLIGNLFDATKMHSSKGTANEKGTGFGLLLCKEFVTKHGGKIWVESELGKGTEFKFTLPR